MLHTKCYESELGGSKEEDFKIFTMYFYGLNPGPLVAGPFWTRGPLSEQTCSFICFMFGVVHF